MTVKAVVVVVFNGCLLRDDAADRLHRRAGRLRRSPSSCFSISHTGQEPFGFYLSILQRRRHGVFLPLRPNDGLFPHVLRHSDRFRQLFHLRLLTCHSRDVKELKQRNHLAVQVAVCRAASTASGLEMRNAEFKLSHGVCGEAETTKTTKD